MSSSVGIIKFPIYGKMELVPHHHPVEGLSIAMFDYRRLDVITLIPI
jgi:hypothetical protein